MKTIVWFEPERVTPGHWLSENHPEWLLGADGGQKLLNLGNPEALEVAHRPRRQAASPSRASTSTARTSTWTRCGYWRAQRRAGPPGDHREPPRHRLPRLLGRAAPAAPEHADRLLRQRRPPQRPRDDAPRRAAPAERLHLRARRPAGPHLRPGLRGCRTTARGFIKFDPYIFRSTMCPNTTALLGRAARRTSTGRILRKLIGEWRQVARLLLRRLLPAHAVQPGERPVDGLAVRPPGASARAWCRPSAAPTASTSSLDCI